MLTKEKCKRALRELKMANNYPTSKYNDSRLIDFHLITFEQLIEEHFNNMDYAISLQNEIEKLKSNPPLKFEELKEGCWVWDNKNQLYVQIEEDFDENGIIVLRYYEDSYNSNCERTRFEENRFYRYEVKE